MAAILSAQAVVHINPRTLSPSIRVSQGETHRLPCDGQSLHVISGCAWVTFDDEDHIVNSGETITLGPGHYNALVSPLSRYALLYELIDPAR